jgi:hypothetical protein
MSATSNRKMTLQQAPRSVIGYYGCSREAAEAILAKDRFLVSTNTYDWLGEGVYFWEYAPYRALEWARERYEAHGTESAVLSATLRLGDCLNLLDRKHFADLKAVYTRIMQSLPENRRQP